MSVTFLLDTEKQICYLIGCERRLRSHCSWKALTLWCSAPRWAPTECQSALLRIGTGSESWLGRRASTTLLAQRLCRPPPGPRGLIRLLSHRTRTCSAPGATVAPPRWAQRQMALPAPEPRRSSLCEEREERATSDVTRAEGGMLQNRTVFYTCW